MSPSSLEFVKFLAYLHRCYRLAIALTFSGLVLLTAVLIVPNHNIEFAGYTVPLRGLYLLLPAMVLLGSCLAWSNYGDQRKMRELYEQLEGKIHAALKSSNWLEANQFNEHAKSLIAIDPLNKILYQEMQPKIEQWIAKLYRGKLLLDLEAKAKRARHEVLQHSEDLKKNTALYKSISTLRETHNALKERRSQLDQQWESSYQKFSWWNKIKYSGGPDFQEMDQMIEQLERMRNTLMTKHSEDLVLIRNHIGQLTKLADTRIENGVDQIKKYLLDASDSNINELPLKAAIWCSALSVPISLWSDFSTAGNIYSALRKVNGNYADMSDSEIWIDTIFMPNERLAGLTALAKGAYFEELVANNTGGELFEHFNHPATDILIDGQAFQIKATASADYVNSVDIDIPVIAPTEVAEYTRAIDAGINHEDLEISIDLALGGVLIDAKDTAIDALLSGAGGLGFMATIQGINHAAKLHESGGDGVEAVFEGAGVAIEGTARALVGTAELGYNVLNSRPSRFIGRTLLVGLKKLDDKIMEAGSNSK